MGHTPITDIYTLVNVKYAYDYEEDEYKKETGYCDGYDFFGNGDGFFGYYINGLEDGYKYKNNGLEREGNILEFESKQSLLKYIDRLRKNLHTTDMSLCIIDDIRNITYKFNLDGTLDAIAVS